MGSVRAEISKNLSFYRKKFGITQKEFAQKLNVSSTAVSNWEKGINSIDIDTLSIACNILNISFADIFGIYAKRKKDFSIEEEIIKKFHELDDRGQSYVLSTLEREYSYVKNDRTKSHI